MFLGTWAEFCLASAGAANNGLPFFAAEPSPASHALNDQLIVAGERFHSWHSIAILYRTQATFVAA
jgi:hypothetical protein